MALLEFINVSHRYDGQPVLNELSFEVESGRIACLLGASGCGKTTALRCIAGFEPLQSGAIRLAGGQVSAPGKNTPAEKRRVGMVFQDYALFPHLTVAKNVAFGLKKHAENSSRVKDMLALVGLPEHGQRYPHELSGGQQQRVAIARALAPEPRLLLLDEPFSNLDVDLRERLSLEVRDIIKRAGITAILVTHDQHEAFALADDIGVLANGALQQWDTPYNLYHKPDNRLVADFIGQGVFLPGRVLDQQHVEIELGVLSSHFPVNCRSGCANCAAPCKVEVLLRPDDIVHDDASPLRARVVHKAFRGADILYTLALESGAELLSLAPSHHNHAIDEAIGIRLDVDHVVAFRDGNASR